VAKIDYQQAREFLEIVSPQDRTMIFTHTDLDGFAAGILLFDYLTKKGARTDVKIINYGISRISDTDLKGVNKVFLTDLAPGMIWEDLAKLGGKEIFYTDHHPEEKDKPIPAFVQELRTTSQGYLPSTRTIYELLEKESKDKLWLATLGVLSDFAEKYPENNEFLQSAYKQLGLSHEELMKYLFKLNFALIGAPSLEDAFMEISDMKSLEDITNLAKYYEPVEREMQRIRNDYSQNKEIIGRIGYYNLETKYPGLKSAFINIASVEDPGRIFVFSTKKGNKIVSLSARDQSREYDMNLLLKAAVENLEDSEAGGHKSAAGASIKIEDLEKVKEKLRQINVEDYKL
jgi:single-stranded DNA-specific DHH superfamily exonuclease